MPRGIVRTLAALLTLSLSHSDANAQPSTVTLTLEEAIAQGLANSMRVAELQARVEAAEAVEQGRAAARLPIVSLQAGYLRTNHIEEFAIVQPGQPFQVLYPDIPDNYRSRLDLQWPIYTSGRADALERAARAEREAAGEDLEAARADLRLEISRAFWALVTARETAIVVDRSLDSIEAHVRDLRNRLQQGLIPPNEVLTGETQLARDRLLAIEAENARAIAEADLQRLLGVEKDQALQPRATLEPASAAPAAPADVARSVESDRAERRALVDRLEAANARSVAAAAAARPQVGVGAGYDYARPNPRIFPRSGEWEDSWDVSVNVSWALWDAGRNRAERAEAAAAASGLKARLADLDRQIAFEIRQRQVELASNRAAVPVADDAVKAAAEALRVLGERFNAGVATSTEVLDAQTDVIQSELSLKRALANVRLAEARLERAVGRR